VKRIVFLLSILMIVTACDNKSKAPFGMVWGSSIYKFPKEGLMTFNLVPLSDTEDMIYVTTVPKDGLGDGGYRFIYKNKKLNRIEFNTYDETSDLTGEKAKIKYEALKSNLAERYGKPSKVDEHVYSDDFRFIPCITNQNCGRWESIFIEGSTIAKISIEMGLTEEGYKKTSESSMVKVEFTPK